MPCLSQILSRPVIDASGVEIGRIHDLAIQTGEVFPRITAVAFVGPSKTPFMVSWRKYVSEYDGNRVVLNTASHNIRFSYLQPDELLLARDLLNKQIVDTQGLKVVRVNDLKLSQSGRQLRLLGAEVGILGILRSLAPWLERLVAGVCRFLRHPLDENIIAWNYMELVDRDLSSLQLSVTHKRLHELHPADVADILEQLDPQQRAKVFEHLDAQQAAETMSELDDEYQTDLIDDMSDSEASELLASMDPDDAADIIGDLSYEKAEKLLWLMGVQDSHRIRLLLGYREKTAGGIMTPDFVSVSGEATVAETVEKLRAQSTELETVNYIYTVDAKGGLTGALSMRSLVLADPQTKVHELAEHDLITAGPDEDQEKIADIIAKYDILALPIVDEDNKILGIVTVDDALDVMEEEHTEDLQIVGAGTLSLGSSESGRQSVRTLLLWFLRRELWFVIWALLAFLATMSGNLKLLAPSLVFMPFVLLVATDTVSFALNDLIEYKSSGTQDILRLFGRNLVAAVFVAAAAALLGLLFLTGIDETFGGDFVSAAAHLLTGFAAAVAACFAVIAASVLVTIVARRRLDRDQPLSLTGLTLVAMGFGLAVQIALQLVMALSASA